MGMTSYIIIIIKRQPVVQSEADAPVHREYPWSLPHIVPEEGLLLGSLP